MESADLDAFDCFLVLDMAIRLARMRDALASEEHEVLFFRAKRGNPCQVAQQMALARILPGVYCGNVVDRIGVAGRTRTKTNT